MVSAYLSVCVWLSQAKTTELISMTFCTTMAYVPRSDIGILSFRYLFPFQGGGSFSDFTPCQIGTMGHVL